MQSEEPPPGAERQPGDAIDFQLVDPITDDEGKHVSVLRCEPFAVRHLWQAGEFTNASFSELLAVQAARCGMPLASFRKLPVAKAIELVNDVQEALIALAEALSEPGPEIDTSGPYILELERPPSLGGESVPRLIFQPLLAEHVWRKSTGELSMQELLRIAASQCGQPESLIGKLGWQDARKVIQVVRAFFPQSTPTPRTQ